MIKAVFLDMDDTLIVNQVLYEHAGAMLCGYLRYFGVAPDDSSRVLAATNIEMFKTLGYSRTRFPGAFEAVLKHFVPQADAEMVEIVRGFAETVFTTVAPVKPGVAEAIDLLLGRYPVYIVTQGDKSVQEDRLSHLPFKDKLTGAFIVKKKDRQTFAAVAQQLGYKPEEVVMVGDSLKSDIAPAVAAGLHAIWIEAQNWSVEVRQIHSIERVYKFSSLLEAARHLVAYEMSALPVAAPSKKSPRLPKFG